MIQKLLNAIEEYYRLLAIIYGLITGALLGISIILLMYLISR